MKVWILVLLVSVVVGSHAGKPRGKGNSDSSSGSSPKPSGSGPNASGPSPKSSGSSHKSSGSSHKSSGSSHKSSGSSHKSSGSSHKSSGSSDEYGDLSCYVCKGVDDPLTCSSDDANLQLCKLRYTQCVTKKIEIGGVVIYDLGCVRPNYKPCLDQPDHVKGKINKTFTATCCDTSGCNAGVPSCSVDGGCGAGECRTDDGTGLDYCYCENVPGFPSGATNGPNCVEDVCGPNNECEQAGQLCFPLTNPPPFGPYVECEDDEGLLKEQSHN